MIPPSFQLRSRTSSYQTCHIFSIVFSALRESKQLQENETNPQHKVDESQVQFGVSALLHLHNSDSDFQHTTVFTIVSDWSTSRDDDLMLTRGVGDNMPKSGGITFDLREPIF